MPKYSGYRIRQSFIRSTRGIDLCLSSIEQHRPFFWRSVIGFLYRLRKAFFKVAGVCAKNRAARTEHIGETVEFIIVVFRLRQRHYGDPLTKREHASVVTTCDNDTALAGSTGNVFWAI